MNMWEDGDKIYADVMQYENAPLFPNVDGSPGTPASARLCRWTFDLSGKTDTIARAYLDDSAGEFPRLDERRAGLPYRHGYFAANSRNGTDVKFDAIAHIDFATGKKSLHSLPKGDAVGEPVFVPRTAAAGEGDGFLVPARSQPRHCRAACRSASTAIGSPRRKTLALRRCYPWKFATLDCDRSTFPAVKRRVVLTPNRPDSVRFRGHVGAPEQPAEDRGDGEECRDVAHQMPHVSHAVRHAEGLLRHDCAMHEAGRDSEPDQAAIGERIARSEDEENAQHRVNADDHHVVVVGIGCAFMPGPARGPNNRERIDQQKGNAENNQRNFKK